jgi:hypothetical protein
MPNPLQTGAPPPLPEQAGQGNGLQVNAPASPASPANGQPAAAQPAPPTHEQTVAALRHFDAIKGGLQELLKDPVTGRSDVKDKIIDGMAKLVSERMVSAPQAVMTLSQVPSDPVAQRKWLQTQLQQTLQAEAGIMEHHRNTNLGSGDWATEAQKHASKPDDHMGHMSALAANYGGKK